MRLPAGRRALVVGISSLACASAPGADSLTLSWQPGGVGVAGYHVYYGPSSRNYTNVLVVRDATNVTVSGLVPGATYFFTARAHNRAGLEGGYATEITFTNAVAPNAIQGLEPSDNLTGSLSLSPLTFTANARRGAFRVAAAAGVSWDLAAPAWLTFSSTNGNGSFAGSFDAAGNTGAARTGTVLFNCGTNTISLTVTQQALLTGAVALLAPVAAGTNRAPQLVWSQSDPPGTWFYVWLNRDGARYLAFWLQGMTHWTPPTDLPAGSYTWWIQPWNQGGYGPWSAPGTFAVQVPATVAPLWPAADTAPAATQRYVWQADPLATWYELNIIKDGSLFLDRWYTSSNSVVDPATGQFGVDVSQPALGTYQWSVRGWNATGYGLWSGSPAFANGAATPLAPTGAMTYSVPVFSWTAVPGASWYRLWLNRNGAYFYSTWIQMSQAWTPTWDFQAYPGNYDWWVQTWNTGGYGPWSASASFTVP